MRWGCAAVALVTAAYLFPAIRCGMVLSDDGVLWGAAARILGGQVPGRDFPVIYPPGEFYAVAAALALGKGSWIAYRALWLGVRCVATALAWSVARRFLSPTLAALGIAPLILVPGHWHKSSLALVPLAIIWATFRWIEDRSRVRFIALGVVIGAACLLRHDIGGLAALAATGAVASVPGSVTSRARRAAGLFGISFGLFAAVHGALGVSPLRFVDVPLAMAAAPTTIRAAVPYPGPGDLMGAIGAGDLSGAIELSFYFWPFALALAMLLWALRKRRLKEALLAATALCLVQSVWWYSNYGHLVQALPLSLLVTTVAAGYGIRRGGARRMLGSTGIAAVCAYLMYQLAYCADLATAATPLHVTRMGVPVDTAIGEVHVTQARARHLPSVLDLIDSTTKPTDPIFVFPMDALYYSLSGHPNPTPFDVLGHHAYKTVLPDATAERSLAERLVEAGVPIVLLDESISFLNHPRAPEQRMTHYAKGLLEELTRSYTVHDVIGTTLLLRRRSAR